MRRKLGVRKDKILSNGPCPLCHLPTRTHTQLCSGETQSKKQLDMKPHYKWNHSGVSVSQHGGPGFMKGT